MIKLISGKVACFLCKCEDEETTELFEYAAYIVLSAILHMATVIVLGLCFNMLVESLVFYASFILIRKFAGGYHAKTPTRCYLFSILTSVLVLVTIRSIQQHFVPVLVYMVVALNVLCEITVLVLSPLDTENKKLSQNEKIAYKKISIIMSLPLFIISTWLLLTGIKSFGLSIGGGIVVSALVLIMRKVQKLKG